MTIYIGLEHENKLTINKTKKNHLLKRGKNNTNAR